MLRASLMASAILLLMTGVARSEEDKNKSEKLPKAVAKTVKESFPKAKVAGVEKEKKDGKTTYEVKLRYKHGRLEVVFNSEGKILKVEMEGKGEDDEEHEKKADKEHGEKRERKAKKKDKGDDDEEHEKKSKKKHKDDDDEKHEKKSKKKEKDDDDEKHEKKGKKKHKDDDDDK